ncbi:MAG: DUF393 domain-containing protein [Bryobacteraceae bacterium]|nr:DUF393 domain-containing protein [Bryobacteraceae bacterium]MDW8376671.1 DUF393 domain-containing protein [Bryobacterales bacterium]
MVKIIACVVMFSSPAAELPRSVPSSLEGSLFGGVEDAFQQAARLLVLVSTASLLLNRVARLSCLVLGAVLLLEALLGPWYVCFSQLVCALLLLAAAGPMRFQVRLVRGLTPLLFLGSGFMKFVDPRCPAAPCLPVEPGPASWILRPELGGWPFPLLGEQSLAWAVVAMEGTAAVLLTLPGLRNLPFLFSFALQAALFVLVGGYDLRQFAAIQAAVLVGRGWPGKPLLAIWDASCDLCGSAKRWLGRVDFDRVIEWRTLQSGEASRYGIPEEAARKRLQVVTALGERLEGFHAVRRLLIALPLTWMSISLILVAVPTQRWRAIFVTILAICLSPGINPAGVALYDWVARNRHRIFSRSGCPLPPA